MEQVDVVTGAVVAGTAVIGVAVVGLGVGVEVAGAVVNAEQLVK